MLQSESAEWKAKLWLRGPLKTHLNPYSSFLLFPLTKKSHTNSKYFKWAGNIDSCHSHTTAEWKYLWCSKKTPSLCSLNNSIRMRNRNKLYLQELIVIRFWIWKILGHRSTLEASNVALPYVKFIKFSNRGIPRWQAALFSLTEETKR